jgi:tRNA(Ile)-lysidine synthase
MLKNKVLDVIHKYNLIPKSSKLLVGVSGGPDSLVLLHFLKQIQSMFAFDLLVAHVDHMFRGDESYEDYLFVEQICKEWGIAFEGTRIDVPAYMKQTGESTELAARNLRYRFFEQVMNKYECTVLVLGHHGDDQVETMLMRLTRGASGKARAGIPIKRAFQNGHIIRPFLGITKMEITEYAVEHGLEPRLDPSNESDDYVRNRFRHHVLPFLKQENPLVHEQFQRFSEEIYEDEDFFHELVSRKMNEVWIERTRGFAIISIDSLLAMPKPLQRRAIQLILNYLYLERPSSLAALHINQLLTLFLNPQPSAELHLPGGLIIEKSYSTCIFRFSKYESLEYTLLLQIPGDTFLPNGYKIKAQYIGEATMGGNDTLLLPVSSVSLPLTVRSRQEGDRMRVKGLGGTKKIKDIFINEKVPLFKRNSWPVVIDGTGQIIWLPGLKKSYIESQSVIDHSSFIYLQYQKS